MGPLQGLGSGWGKPGVGPRDARGAVVGSAHQAGGTGQCSGHVGRTLESRAQGRGSGVPIGAGWEAQAVPTAALESPAWLCQPPGSNRVKWRP